MDDPKCVVMERLITLAEMANWALEEYKVNPKVREISPNLRLIVVRNEQTGQHAPLLVSDKVPIRDGWVEVAGPFENAYQAFYKAWELETNDG